MSEVMAQDGAAKHGRIRKPHDDLVSGYKLAAHLGIAGKPSSARRAGVLTRRPDGLFDRSANRLAY